MNDLENKVEWMLKNYLKNRDRIEMLKFDIHHFSGITNEEMLESLVYKKSSNERVQTSIQTDETGNIALKFREYTNSYNEETLKELVKEYSNIVSEVELIENRVNFLPNIYKKVIVDLYFNGLTWSQVAKDNYISDTHINRYKKKGITQLAKLCETRLSSQSVSK